MNGFHRVALVGLLVFSFVAPVRAADIKVEEVTSPSGIKAWLVQDSKLPLIAMHFVWRGGVEQDTVDKQGLARLSTGLLMEGAGPYDAHAFQQALADDSIQLGFAAGRDTISGSLKVLRETRDKAATLLHAAITNPHFDTDEIERARHQQMAAIKASMGSPEWQARYALFQTVFPEHPYSFRSLGSTQTLASITKADIQSFAQQHLAKDNLVVAVAGAISPAELSRMLDVVFGSLPDHAVLTSVAVPSWPSSAEEIGLDRESTQTNVMWALPGPKRNDPDWYAAEVVNYTLGGGGFSSRLMQAVRDDKGLTYGISTSLATMDQAGLIVGSMATDNPKTKQALDIVTQVWDEFFRKGPTADEIQAAKNYLTGAMPLALTSTDAIASFLVQMQIHHLGKDYLQQRTALIQKVDEAAVRRVLDRWFNSKQMVFSMVGRPDDVSFTERRGLIRE